jgi:citrate lyase subunit beta/citryl-CoA lyase
VNDEAGFLREVELIRKMGFNGKSLINPRQIDLLHNVCANPGGGTRAVSD